MINKSAKLREKYKGVLLENGDDIHDILHGRLGNVRPIKRAQLRAAADGSKSAQKACCSNNFGSYRKYIVIKTIFGHTDGEIVAYSFDLDDARAQLIRELSFIDKGYDNGFCADEKGKQAEIEFMRQRMELDRDPEAQGFIDNIQLWTPPCIFDRRTGMEITHIENDEYYYDNYHVEIVEV